ncbi:MAG TPA: S46 family peptidase, partial [Pyrinomonadaceae bacterium]|nr:S46 family peptidase [Pyrinomonadaceae bacterium]
MKKITALAFVFVLVLSSLPVFADDGMWTFDNPPRKQWKEKYNFEPTDAWLDHVRLSSVKVEGSSGAFVSPNGLLM